MQVPWWAPARFWDLYPLEKVPPVPHPGLVTANVAVAMQDWQASLSLSLSLTRQPPPAFDSVSVCALRKSARLERLIGSHLLRSILSLLSVNLFWRSGCLVVWTWFAAVGAGAGLLRPDRHERQLRASERGLPARQHDVPCRGGAVRPASVPSPPLDKQNKKRTQPKFL